MKKISGFLLVVVCFFMGGFSYSKNLDQCKTVFIEQPFLSISNPDYDSKEFLSLSDKTPVSISSISLESKSINWKVELSSKKDVVKLFSYLLNQSDISLDEVIFVMVNLIDSKIAEFKNININQSRLYLSELIADIFGMRNLVILDQNIKRYHKYFYDIMPLWSSSQIKKVYEEINLLSELIKKNTKFSDESSFFDYLSTQPKEKRSQIIFQVIQEEFQLVSKELKEFYSDKFKNLDKIISVFDPNTLKMIIHNSLFYNPISYCWYVYFDKLKEKTIESIKSLTHAYLIFKDNLENESNIYTSEFLIENNPVFLKKISSRIKVLEHLEYLVTKFRIEDTRIKTAGLPLLVYEKHIHHLDKFLSLSNEQIYSGLVDKINSSSLNKYSDTKFLKLKFTPLNVIQVFYDSIKNTYKSIPIDRSAKNCVYNYYTDFSLFKYLSYQQFLANKYGFDSFKTLGQKIEVRWNK